ncbi:MAG: transposase [Anaerolineales bacterium]|nr:transposase [Anaerolineales bacterium]
MAQEKLKEILQAATLELPFRAFLISRQGEIIAQRNQDVAVSSLERIAFRLERTWSGNSANVQVQFLQASLPANELIFYTRELEKELLLTIGAMTETSIARLRQQADIIAQLYLQAHSGRSGPEEVLLHRPVNGTKDAVYAIVWQPLRPLPASQHQTLQHSLTQLAESNGCQLHHLGVDAGYIQVLVACPPGRSSAWAAHLLKSGSEQGLQQQNGSNTPLWRPGYYASEAKVPFPADELKRVFVADGS